MNDDTSTYRLVIALAVLLIGVSGFIFAPYFFQYPLALLRDLSGMEMGTDRHAILEQQATTSRNVERLTNEEKKQALGAIPRTEPELITFEQKKETLDTISAMKSPKSALSFDEKILVLESL